MNKTFNTSSCNKGATTFHQMIPTIDYSKRSLSKSNCRVKLNSDTAEKIITEEELLQTIWLS